MRLLIAFTILGSLAGAAAADEPESPAPTWTIQIGPARRTPTTSSAVTLTEEDLFGTAAAVERRLFAVGVPGPFPVADVTVGLAVERTAADGETFDQLFNRIETWQLTGTARARLPIRSWLLVQARASIGGGETSVRISDRFMTTSIYDDGAMAVAGAGLGLAILPRLTRRDSRRFHVGFETELGYQVTSARTIHATPEDRPPPELTIPAHYAALGDLRLDGWTWRVGLSVGF